MPYKWQSNGRYIGPDGDIVASRPGDDIEEEYVTDGLLTTGHVKFVDPAEKSPPPADPEPRGSGDDDVADWSETVEEMTEHEKETAAEFVAEELDIDTWEPGKLDEYLVENGPKIEDR